MFDVFLAYNSKDKAQVRTIAKELRQRGLNPWLDEEQMWGGDTPIEELQKGISESKSVVFFVGLDGSGNWQGNFELPITVNLVLDSGLRLIPVLLPGVQEIPNDPQYFFLRTKLWISFESNDDVQALNRLEKSIKKQIKVEEIKREQKEAENKPEVIESVPESKPTFETKSQLISPQILTSFEFDVVTVEEVKRSGLLGLSSKVTLNRSHSQAEYFTEDLGNDITLDMVAIPGGKFLMGTEDEEIERLCKKYNGEWFRREKPQHEVKVSPFFMGKYPITQAQWKAIAFLPKVERDLKPKPSNFTGDQRPVEKVSWYDAVEFCQRLSEATGNEYRLPTEAEWEYACRAVTSPFFKGGQGESYPPFHFGETITTDLANYDSNYIYANEPKGKYREQTTLVGSFPPNAFGLYDMHGNVWEWCADTWHDNYEGAPNDGSAWTDSDNDNRSPLRGGSWYRDPYFCRSAYRYSNVWGRVKFSYLVGFRVVCVAGRTL